MNSPLQADVRRINTDHIRDELRELWASEGMSGEAVIRARSHNLIVYTTGEQEHVDETIQRIIEVTSARPGRVILIQDDPDGAEELDAWVTVYCQMQDHTKICGEMIVLVAGGGLAAELHSTVISLLAPDLPVYLWWTEKPEQTDHLYQSLSETVDRLIVDSDRFVESSQDLMDLAEFQDIRLGDLAWARLTPWRRQMALLWDVAELREPLNHLRAIDVMYVATEDFANASRALLFVGWLADRFEWELDQVLQGPTGGYITHWRKWGWEGKVELVESSYKGLPPGELTGVFIQAGQSSPFVMPRLEYSEQHGCIDVRLNDASPTGQRRGTIFEPVSTSAALVEELDLRYDAYYERALKRAQEILTAAE